MDEGRFRPPGSPRSMLSGLTHELRTPLNSILMMSELLAEDPDGRLGERESRYARNIHQAAQDLLELVNQAGEIGRIESGRMQVERRPVALADLARRIEEEHREAAEATGTTLTVRVPPGEPETMVTDPAKLVKAVRLVVEAALQGTKGGEVTVTLKAAPERGIGESGGMEVSVVDNGPGVTPGECAAMFVPFGGAGPRTARRFGGTGLALSIAWALARLLGGELAAHPAREGGCRFVLTIPGSSDPREA